jgi:hypothetical protein
MAGRPFVLSEPLCFILSKYGKTQLKLLKTCVTDFFDVDSIVEAKCQLLDDVGQLSLTDKLPHYPRRRDNDGRITREIDDIFSVLNILDEQKLLNSLPRYVSENPDNLPAIRLFDGDLKFLSHWVEKSDCKLDSFSKQLDAIMTQFLSIQSQLSAILKVQSTTPGLQKQQQTRTPLFVNDQLATLGNSHAVSTVVNKNINTVQKQSWSSDTSTPQPRPLSRQLSSSATDNDDQVCQDDTPFLQPRQRSRKKRRRALSNGIQQLEPQRDDQQSHQSADKPSYATVTRSSKPLVIGKLTNTASNSTTTKLLAAKPTVSRIKKSVYCIDNVHKSVSVEDLCEFVENLSVTVMSCFETKPRKHRFESDADDHKAFRLCIASEDNDRLLDSSMWPEFVSVYEWFFKSSVQQTSGPGVVNANVSSRVGTLHVDVLNEDNQDMDATIMDATIIETNNGD